MKKLNVVRVIMLALAIVALLASLSLAAAVPQVINYQGTLTDKNGVSVPDASYNIEFNIYDVATGGTSLWMEKWSSTATPASPVIVTGGVFNAILGALNPLPANFFADHPNAYLGIKVGNDSEMLPRQRVTSVGYAFAAGNGIPKGGIIMWSGAVNQIPEGWALCNGTNGTPNLLDRFIVGAGSGYAVGSIGGEASHVLTINEIPSHTHLQNPHTHSDAGHQHVSASSGFQALAPIPQPGGGYSRSSGTGYVADVGNGYANIQNNTATNQNTGGGSAHNNLPPYYALAFIMKQ